MRPYNGPETRDCPLSHCPHRARHEKRSRRRNQLSVLLRERTSLLRESRTQYALLAAKFHSVFQHAPVGMAVTELDGRILDANLTLCRLLDFTQAELLRFRFADLVSVATSPHQHAPVELAIKGGRKVMAEYSTAVVRDESGAPLFAVIMVEDRTTHMQTQNALRLASIVLRSTTDAVITCDLQGTITSWNPAAEKKFGPSPTDAVGENMWRLLPKDFAEAAATKLKHVLGRSDSQTFEAPCSVQGRKSLDVSATISPIADDEGTPLGFVIAVRDITEQKRLNREMERLDRLNTLGEMAAGVGHEVRNPMTTVRGYLQLLKKRPEFAEYMRHFALMIEELDRMNGIITEFLSLGLAKEDTPRPYKLSTVILELQPLLQAEALLRDMNLTIDLCADEQPLRLITKEIRQLLLNLVRNGMDAMPGGGDLRIFTEQLPGKTVLGIEDSGCGIPPEIIEKLFTPFLTTKEKGTGLGLSICHNIAKRHHASLQVAFTGCDGTRFEVAFPTPPRAD